MQRKRLCAPAVFLVFLLGTCVSLIGQCKPEQRFVTVKDSIEMRRAGVPSYMDDDPPRQSAHFSPDGHHFAIVLKQGNLIKNTNDYSLLVFDTYAALTSSQPEATVMRSSSSNREGIKEIKWLNDNRTILFISETPSTLPQLYSFDIKTKKIDALTSQSTPVVSYDASADGSVIVFEADPPYKASVDTPETRRHGLVVNKQNLGEVLLADNPHGAETSFESRELYLLRGKGKAELLTFEDGVWPDFTLSVSPDGRYVLIEALVRYIPDGWLDYKDRLLHEFIADRKPPTALSWVERYLLLDTRTGSMSPLIDAPKSWQHDEFAWIKGGKSIALSNAYLPLTGIDPKERERRTSQTYAIEVEAATRKIVKITDEPLALSRWDEVANVILFSKRDDEDRSKAVRAFEKDGNAWKDTALPADTSPHSLPSITYDDGMNEPPKIWITGLDNKRMLLDLNPQFRGLCFGREEIFSWTASDGHAMEGGLYYPPDYQPGHRYPLVIQTHAFSPDRFWIDGPWSSAFAAQPLAAKGMLVLQVGGSKDHGDKPFRSTPGEAPRQMAAFEGAVDHLDQLGMIDRNHVGIIGFSRTVYHVAYTLTHSKYRFAAATLADGFNGGYFEQLAFPTATADLNAVNGAAPFGEGLAHWIEHAPTFNMSNVKTPVRLESHSVASTIEEWEWFSLLSQLQKPVDFIVLPEAPHILVRPWEREVSQQGVVDWFAFWLKGEEDPSSEKQEQYTRWRSLRALQEAKQRTVDTK